MVSSREEAKLKLKGAIFNFCRAMVPAGSPQLLPRSIEVETAIDRFEREVERDVRSQYEGGGGDAA